MSGNSNFYPWNPTAANQENDSAFSSDSQRTGGAPNGSVAPSLTYNKAFYQWGILAYALTQMMAAKGFSPVDGTTPQTNAPTPSGAAAALATVLANILTTADYSSIISQVTSGLVTSFSNNSFYVKMPTAFGSFVVQGGLVTTSGDPYTVTFPHAFANTIPVVVAVGDSGTVGVSTVGSPVSKTTFTIQAASGLHVQWIAIGS